MVQIFISMVAVAILALGADYANFRWWDCALGANIVILIDVIDEWWKKRHPAE